MHEGPSDRHWVLFGSAIGLLIGAIQPLMSGTWQWAMFGWALVFGAILSGAAFAWDYSWLKRRAARWARTRQVRRQRRWSPAYWEWGQPGVDELGLALDLGVPGDVVWRAEQGQFPELPRVTLRRRPFGKALDLPPPTPAQGWRHVVTQHPLSAMSGRYIAIWWIHGQGRERRRFRVHAGRVLVPWWQKLRLRIRLVVDQLAGYSP